MKGFTIAEVIIVVAVFSILLVLLITPFSILNRDQALSGSTLIIKATLSEAGSRTLSSDGGVSYGVRFIEDSNDIILFSSEGENSISLNNNITIDSVSLVSGDEVTFDRLTGEVENPGTITISNGTDSKTITIYATGVVE